ncbi:MAG: hypothetical protein KC435_12355 [Thermomicrobiales bacterium]|nr:hypothetical protein [Thermomicrobiales bacterium]
MLLLRPNELACRTRWGTSLWQDRSGALEPDPTDTPQQPSLPEPISVQLQYDDEVTSVSIAGSSRTHTSYDDGVIETTTVKPGSSIWEDDLQSERRELLRQSPHDALAGARKRHMDKQARQRELIPFAEDSDVLEDPSAEPDVEPAIASTQPAAQAHTFPPDDFVEDERASSDADDRQDELVDEGVPGTRRSPRLNHLLRSPKGRQAMTFGAATELSVTAHNPEQREQWNTVPQIQPGFDLPLNTTDTNPPTAARMSAHTAPAATFNYSTRPVSVAREVVTETRQKSERAQRQVQVPLADDRSMPPVRIDEQHPEIETRPRLTHASSNQSGLLERARDSPLRGYRPAPQPTQQRAPQPEVDPLTLRSRPANTTRPEILNESDTIVSEGTAVPVATPASQPQQTRDVESRTNSVDAASLDRPQVKKKPLIPLRVDNSPFESAQIEIAPNVPRCCGTCASYQPGDSGTSPGRGACMNAFTGPVPRMVSERDLGCQHTFGCFWVPADEEVWLDELPVFNEPTPRVDRMVARRERRKSTVLPDLEELTS